MTALNIGDRVRRTRTLTECDIELFTALTGHRNPRLDDPRQCPAARSGDVIMQGGLTTGLLHAVVAEEMPGPGSVFLRVDWHFLAEVRPGDTLTADVEVLEQRHDEPITTMRTTISNQDAIIVLDGTVTVRHDQSAAGLLVETAGTDRVIV